ncbi:galanin receptor type 1-like [Gigantopelta aegis]|uniref:galanin receptor type 1-like n=1 Tax=Gigantopelta aegis TaxID=1735272 RepID=UPI001B88B324|nr:galanin receptor type 1-like [Gigantopelta aegis]
MDTGDTMYTYEYLDHYYAEFDFNYSDLSNFNDNDGEFYIFNDSDDGLEPDFESTKPERQMVPVLFFLIFAVGILGNSLMIYVVSRQPAMRTVTNMYLINLSIVSLLFLLVCVPFTSIAYAITDWPFGGFLCKFVNYIMAVCLLVSVLTLTVTGIDRYYAIVHPMRSRHFRTTKRALAIILSIWVVSTIVMVYKIFLYKISTRLHVYDVRSVCDRSHATLQQRQLDSGVMVVFTFFLPQMILAVCHIGIVRKLWNSVRPGSRPNDITLAALQARRRIAIIIFAITVAFGIGWFPFHMVHLHEDFVGAGDHILFTGREALSFFSYMANAINPIIYCLFSSNFRHHFKMALLCKVLRRRRVRRIHIASQHSFPEEVVALHVTDQAVIDNGIEQLPVQNFLSACPFINDASLRRDVKKRARARDDSHMITQMISLHNLDLPAVV